MSEIQSDQNKELASIPKQIKPVFLITRGCDNKHSTQSLVASKNKWNIGDRLKFIEAIQKYGKEWSLFAGIFPHKNPADIQAHGEEFLEKIRNVGENLDPIEYVKNKPIMTMLSAKLDRPNRFKRKQDSTYQGTPVPLLRKKKYDSEPLQKLSLDRYPAATPTLNEKKQTVKRTRKKKAKEIPEQIPKIEKPQAIVEEEKAEPVPYVNSGYNPIQPLPQSYQYTGVTGKIMEVMQELKMIAGGLETERTNCKGIIDADPQFKYYWEALESCSTSLQNIIADIYYMNMRSSPIQQQYMYQAATAPPQMYYPQEHPRGTYLQSQAMYYQERAPEY